jgi:hypothetical protein
MALTVSQFAQSFDPMEVVASGWGIGPFAWRPWRLASLEALANYQ